MTTERGTNAGSIQEMKESKARIEALTSKVSDLENANIALNQKNSDMAQELENQRSQHRAQHAANDYEIKRLLDDLTIQVRVYLFIMTCIFIEMKVNRFRVLYSFD